MKVREIKDFEIKFEELNEESRNVYGLVSLNLQHTQHVIDEWIACSPIAKIIKSRYDDLYANKNTEIPKISSAVFIAGAILSKGNPGRGILFLMDILSYFEGKKEIELSDVVQYYDGGFYDADTCMNIIDQYIKTSKLKYSEIY